ncbi:hypothetical protein [Yersinia intermedia]|uniref:hypothetical protein n=1 Tax=Yersinia intermedia TaxID=631 RepID=UPI0011AADE16|nr:hypothetical protein [Yersinia intermedia]
MAVKELSKNRDAQCHKKRFEDNKAFGFLQKKIYLGNDTLSKLSLLSDQLTGRSLNINGINEELASDIISTCVSHYYNAFFNGEAPHQHPALHKYPKISAALSPLGQKKYRLYQQVKGRFDKLETGDSDREKWSSVARTLREEDIEKPKSKVFTVGEWSREDVKWILTPENISNWIDESNQYYQQEREKQKLAMKKRPRL